MSSWTDIHLQNQNWFFRNRKVCSIYMSAIARMGDKIDYLRFMDNVSSIESSSSYKNAFSVAGMPYYVPYARLVMADKLDLYRICHGEPKYLIRELMAKKYPEIPVPNKVPMPRLVDYYFADWDGPRRHEFKKDINMDEFTGNQKWQMWCFERFLDMHEPIR